MGETNDIHQKLQQIPVSFPRSEYGTEIRFLKHLFTPKEANLVFYLSAFDI